MRRTRFAEEHLYTSKITFIVCYIMFLLPDSGFAWQEEPQHIAEWQEQQTESTPEMVREDDEQYALLQRYIRHPLDLNTASAGELQELGLLLPGQIRYLLEHREKLGPLLAIYELQSIKGYDLITIRRMLPYVTAGNAFADRVPFRRYRTDGQHVLQIRYTRNWNGPGSGLFPGPEKPPDHLGSADKLMLRYRYTMGRFISWGS